MLGGGGAVTSSPAGVHGPPDDDAWVYKMGIIGGMPGGLITGPTWATLAGGSEGSAASALVFSRNVMAISATMIQPRNFVLQDSTSAAPLPR